MTMASIISKRTSAAPTLVSRLTSGRDGLIVGWTEPLLSAALTDEEVGPAWKTNPVDLTAMSPQQSAAEQCLVERQVWR